MEHLRGAGLIAGAVVEEVGDLLLRLRLVLDLARPVQALGAGHGGDDRGEVGELLGREAHELVAGLGGL